LRRRPRGEAPGLTHPSLPAPQAALEALSWQDALAQRLDDCVRQLGELHARRREATGPDGAAGVPRALVAALVSAAGKAGFLDKAFQIFESAGEAFGLAPDAHAFNALMAACAENGRADTIPLLHAEMAAAGVAADGATFAHLAHSALQEGRPGAAAEHLRAMRAGGFAAPDALLENCDRVVVRAALVAEDAEALPAADVLALQKELKRAGFPMERQKRLRERMGKVWQVFSSSGAG